MLLDPELEFPEAYMRNEIIIENASLKDFLMGIVKNLGRKEVNLQVIYQKKYFSYGDIFQILIYLVKLEKNVEHHYDIGGRKR